MRILILSTFFPPLNSIASLRPFSWAKYWTHLGHDVTVVTTAKKQNPEIDLNFENPGFKLIEIKEPAFVDTLRGSYQKKESTLEPKKTGFKTTVFSLFNQLRHKKGIFNACRMPDFTDFWLPSAWRQLKKLEPFDLTVSSAGPYGVHILGERLKRKKLTLKWVADFRDTWSDNYIYPGLFPFNLLEKVLERRLMRSADFITTVSIPFASHYQAKYGKNRCFSIENGFDASDLALLDEGSIFADDGKFRIVHTGSIYAKKRDPSLLFDAIAKIAEDKSALTLLDSLEVLFAGANQADLPELIKQKKVEKWVKLTGFMSREDALRMQRDAHMLLFLPWNDGKIDGVLTGKLFEYFFSQTPILSISQGPLELSQKLIEEAEAGYVFQDTSPLVNFLKKRLKEGQKEVKIIDSNFLKLYDRKYLASKFLQIVNNSPY